MTVVLDRALGLLSRERVLVTGASGSIGAALSGVLRAAGVVTYRTDVEADYNSATVQFLDVREAADVMRVVRAMSPTLVFHLAGAKHAPEGEIDPWSVMETNAVGTRNVLAAADAVGARVVLASTGKAADPETAYGASKLIAERMVLNAGGSVARFFNVRESSGNVFRIWEGLPADAPLRVAPCTRYFISLAEAVGLLVWAAVLESGRYVVEPGLPEFMPDVAAAAWPGREMVPMEPRRGDRMREPLHAMSESLVVSGVDGVGRLVSIHDVVLHEGGVVERGELFRPGVAVRSAA